MFTRRSTADFMEPWAPLLTKVASLENDKIVMFCTAAGSSMMVLSVGRKLRNLMQSHRTCLPTAASYECVFEPPVGVHGSELHLVAAQVGLSCTEWSYSF